MTSARPSIIFHTEIAGRKIPPPEPSSAGGLARDVSLLALVAASFLAVIVLAIFLGR